MIHDIQEHLGHYAALAGILMAGLIGFLMMDGNEQAQLIVMGFVGLAYVLWGVVHHRHEEDLTFMVVLEYTLTAILIIILLWGVLTHL
jgi:hypothetical protein